MSFTSSIFNQDPFVAPTLLLILLLIVRHAILHCSAFTLAKSLRNYIRFACSPCGAQTSIVLLYITAMSGIGIIIFEEYFFVYECAVSQRYFDENVELARAVIRILNAAAIPFWLDYASMLAAIREQSINPWDHDVDASILHPDYSSFVHHHYTFSTLAMSGQCDPGLLPETSKLMGNFIRHGLSVRWDGARHLIQIRFNESCQPHFDLWLWQAERSVDGRSIDYWTPFKDINYNGRVSAHMFPLVNATWLGVRVGMVASSHDVARLEYAEYAGSYLVAKHVRADCTHNLFNGRWNY